MWSIDEVKEAERSRRASSCVDDLRIDLGRGVALACACGSKQWDSAAV